MTVRELAIQETTVLVQELIARDELKLAEAILERCLEHAKSSPSKEATYHCSVLMMYCKKEDDDFLKKAQDEIPPLIMRSPLDGGKPMEIFKQNNACRYTVYWNLKLIYIEKFSRQTNEDLKDEYNHKIKYYERIIAQRSYSHIRDVKIEHPPASMMSCDSTSLKQEAETILKLLSTRLLYPQSAEEIVARYKNMTGEIDAALEYCNEALLAKPNSSSRLELKLDILLKHIRLHLNNNDDGKLTAVIKQYVAIKPSAEMYYKLGLAYSRQSKFLKAYKAFRKARVHQKDYESESVSLNIIHALFQSAETRKQFKDCAKKLSNHLTRFPSTERVEAIQTMIDYFKEEKLLLDCNVLYLPDPGTPRKKLHSVKKESEESSFCVPQDIKEKTREALLRMSFYHDKSVSGRDALDEEKINWDDVHPMGGENSRTYAYIPQGKIPPDRLAKYLSAIKKPIEGPASKGKACPKKLTDGRVEIKTKGKSGKYRLLSTATFFTFKLNKTASEDESDTKQLNTVYRFSSEKTHNQV